MRNVHHWRTQDTAASCRQRPPKGMHSARLPTRRPRSATRRFGHDKRGATTIETALGVMILVVSLAVLMEVVHVVYTNDEMARAARAAARALALDDQADICEAIRRELQLAANFDCNAEWRLDQTLGVGPLMLPQTLDGNAPAGTGELVLVRIGWDHQRWSLSELIQDASARGTVAYTAMGLHRIEP